MPVSGFLRHARLRLLPVSPPRLADLGLVDSVTDSSAAYRWWQPPAFVNQYAAMPGLHADRELLVGMASFSAASTVLLRPVGVVLPILMTWSVGATANPYVLDVVAGIALALVGHAVALLVARRRASRAALGGRRPG